MKPMKRLTVLLVLAAAAAGAQPARKPKLVLAITVDQFRYDYLTRFREDYTEGLHLLLSGGAVFTSARLEHFPTVTAIGHSTFMTGAIPAVSGIIGNDWFDRETGRQVTSVSDPSFRLLGGAGEGGASPRRLLVSTIGDELKIASGGRSKVIGISFKDRSAVLSAGYMADGAYWYDSQAGSFVSSTYYFPDLPAWVKSFNAGRPADRYRDATWLGRRLPAEGGAVLYAAVAASPFGNDLIESLAERAVVAEGLGSDGATDLLAVSFSSNDYVGHEFGPESLEVREMALRTDRALGRLFRFLDERIGMGDVLVVLTADHGVAPLPEANLARKMPGGRMPSGLIRQKVQAQLASRYGDGEWISSPNDHSLYLNRGLIAEKKLDTEEVASAAQEAALSVPHVLRAYTRGQLLNGRALGDPIGRRVSRGFHAQRGADLYVLLEPYWLFAARGTSHGTAFNYDAHVPVIFMGPGIKAGRYHQTIEVNDIAPTLATILGVATPSGSVGRVLAEIFVAD